MADGKLRRCIRFHRDAIMSGGGKGIALAGLASLVLGGSVGAVVSWLANVSWVIAALVAMASLFVFYAWGAYRVWDEADRRAQDAEAALKGAGTAAGADTLSLRDFVMSDDSKFRLRSSASNLARGGGMAGQAELDAQHFPGRPELFGHALWSEGEQERAPQAEAGSPGEAGNDAT